MGIFASSSMSAHYFSFPRPRNTRCYGHLGKKIELVYARRLGQDDDEVLERFIDSEHRTRGEL
jgi:hypothetical protein